MTMKIDASEFENKKISEDVKNFMNFLRIYKKEKEHGRRMNSQNNSAFIKFSETTPPPYYLSNDGKGKMFVGTPQNISFFADKKLNGEITDISFDLDDRAKLAIYVQKCLDYAFDKKCLESCGISSDYRENHKKFLKTAIDGIYLLNTNSRILKNRIKYDLTNSKDAELVNVGIEAIRRYGIMEKSQKSAEETKS